MGTLDIEETALKKKLDDADSLEERREIRRQLRELRNKKFEEEVKKVTAGDYRPTSSTITNGTDSSSSRVGKSAKAKRQESEDDDAYGLLAIDDEDELQALLNDTPFTETDKRRKIRARLREIRNVKLGIGEPVVIKRSKIEREPEKITAEPLQYSSSTREEKDVEDGYRSRRHKEIAAPSEVKEYTDTRKINRGETEEKSSWRYDSKDKNVESQDTEMDGMVEDEANEEAKNVENIENNREDHEDISSEGSYEDHSETKADDGDHAEDECADVDDEDIVDDVDDINQEEESGNEAETAVDHRYDDEGDIEEYGEQESDTQRRDEYDEDDEKDQPMRDDVSGRSEQSYESDEEKLSQNEEDEFESEDIKVAEPVSDQEEESDEMEEEEPLHDDEVKYQDDEEGEAFREDADYKGSEKDYNDDSVEEREYQEERRGRYGSVESGSSRDRSDSSASSEISAASKGKSSIYSDVLKPAAYVEEKLRAKEPGLEDGMGFKDLLRKSSKSFEQKGKAGAEQVDFRTVLKSTEKPKYFGDRPVGPAEQVDFRVMLKTGDTPDKFKKGLADKRQQSVEQLDFRTVLSRTGSQSSPRKIQTQGEQVDFRSSLKKKSTPSIDETEDKPRKTSAGKINFKENLRRTGSVDKDTTVPEPERKISTKRAESKKDVIESKKSEVKKTPDAPKPKPKPKLKAKKHEIEETISVEEEREVQAEPVSVEIQVQADPVLEEREVQADPVLEEREVQADPVLEEREVQAESVSEEKTTVPVEEKERSSSLENTTAVSVEQKRKSSSLGRSTARIEQKEKSSSLGRDSKMQAKLKEIESRGKVNKFKENRFLKKDVVDKEKSMTEPKVEDKSKPRSRRVVRTEEDTQDIEKKPIETTKQRTRRVIRVGDEDTESSVNKEEKPNEVVAGKDEADGAILSKAKEREQRTAPKSKPIPSNTRKPVERVSSNKSEQEQPVKKDEDSDEEIGQRRNRALARRLEKSANETLKFLEDIENKKKARTTITTMNTNVAESRKPRELKADVSKDIKITSKEEVSVSSKRDKISVDLKIKEKEKEPEEEKEEESTDKTVKSDAAQTKAEAAKARKERMAALETRMAERRRQRAVENRKKQKTASEGRNAFKQQLDKHAPKGDGSRSPALNRADSNMGRLLLWTQKLTNGYPGVEVTDFSSSWSDGLAFCALLHNFVPHKVQYNKLTKDNQRENFELAFSVATEEGVPELLEVDDMVRMKNPDPKSLITYLHSIYQVMVAERQ